MIGSIENIVQKHEGKVSIVKGVCKDLSRNGRDVPYKVYGITHTGVGKRPLILWSHGLGGSRDGAGFLARFLVEHGYFVMHIQHEGTDTSLWEGKPGHPWDVIRATPITREVTLDRYRDVSFILDQLPMLEKEHALIRGHIDYDRLGMSGHSFGALTAQVMAGQLFPNEDDVLSSYKEARFKAGVLYSFSGMSHLSDAPAEHVFGGMDIPLLFMSGTKDDSPISGQDYTHRLPAYAHARAVEKHVLIIEEGDHMIFTGSRGKLAFNPKREVQEALIQASSLAFWEAYLNDNQDAKTWLTGDGFQEQFGPEMQYKYKETL